MFKPYKILTLLHFKLNESKQTNLESTGYF
jgi:hypothetical protein